MLIGDFDRIAVQRCIVSCDLDPRIWLAEVLWTVREGKEDHVD